MPNDQESRQSHVGELLPFQAEFVDRFTEPGSSPNHLLVGPPGSGKTAVISHIVERTLASGRNRRVLILAPRPIVEQQAYLLRAVTKSGSVQVVDRYRYREMEAEAPVGQSPWPDAIVALMSIDFAKQEDISDGLPRVSWDLVIVDESHLLSGRRDDVLRRLIDSGSVKRLLMMSATPVEQPAWLPELVTTDWRSSVADLLSKLKVPLRKETVAFSYTRKEVAVFDRLGDLLAHLDAASSPRMLQLTLLNCARSSLYALEASLLRLRDGLTNGWKFPAFDADVSGGEQLLWEHQTQQLPESHVRVGLVEDLLTALGEVEEDSKLNALNRLLEGLVSDRITSTSAVLTCYVATADYLSSTLADRGYVSTQLTGSIPVEERAHLLEDVFASQGLLVATEAATQKLNLLRLRYCVLYDVPKNTERLEQAMGRMWRPGRSGPLDVFLFDDTSLVGPRELLARFESGGAM